MNSNIILNLILFLPILSVLPTYLISRRDERKACFFTLIILACNFLLAIFTVSFLFDIHSTGFQLLFAYKWLPVQGMRYYIGVDGISMVLVLLDTFLFLVVGWASYYMIPQDKGEWYSTLLTLYTGALGVILAINLAVFYVFWELVLIPMFFMIGKWGHKPKKARKAAIKFVIFTFAGGVIMLLGFIYLYSQTGTLNMINIANMTHLPVDVQTIAMFLIFFGLAVKLPVFPFHTWLPDAHVEGPAPSSALLAGILLKEAAYMFMRCAWFIPKGMKAFTLPFSILAIIGIVYPVVTAIFQSDMKRMTSYFSVNHMATVFFAATAAANATSSSLYQLVIAGSVFVIMSHGIIMSTLFLGAGMVYKITGTREIEELGGLANARPWLAALLVIGWVAAGGMPGLAAFVGEVMVYIGGINILFSEVGWWVSFAIVGPLIVLSFFIWLAQRTFFGELSPELKLREISWFELLPFVALTVFNILVGVFPMIFNIIMKESIASLFGM